MPQAKQNIGYVQPYTQRKGVMNGMNQEISNDSKMPLVGPTSGAIIQNSGLNQLMVADWVESYWYM